MKKREASKLAQGLAKIYPDFAVSGRLLFRSPVGHTLRALCFENSSDANSFYIWGFFLPLCVPRKYLSFSFGERLKSPNGEAWDVHSLTLAEDLKEAFQRQAIPLLSGLESLKEVALAAFARGNLQNPQVIRTIAYVRAQAGEFDKAECDLERLCQLLDTNVDWQDEIFKEASKLRALILRDPHAAKQQLDDWEAESIRSLGLERFR